MAFFITSQTRTECPQEKQYYNSLGTLTKQSASWLWETCIRNN